jgi:hypothetical protein
VLLHLVASVSVTSDASSELEMPEMGTAGFFLATRTSDSITSCRARPACSSEAGALSAARIVGARSISSGCYSNGRTFGPTATIVPLGGGRPCPPVFLCLICV